MPDYTKNIAYCEERAAEAQRMVDDIDSNHTRYFEGIGDRPIKEVTFEFRSQQAAVAQQMRDIANAYRSLPS